MAGTPPPVETPKLGLKATIAGLVFALTILAGFGAATAASYDADAGHGDDHSDDYDDHSDDDHADEGEDDHSDDDDHADDDHSND